jgi:hypothetical protein
MTGSCKPLSGYFKVVVSFERRGDGGLRAYSDDVPGFVLSHSDPSAVLADIQPALETILSHMFEAPVEVSKLPRLHERSAPSLSDNAPPENLEYVTHHAA